MDRAIDSTTTHQRRVRGVDDRMGILPSDVPGEKDESSVADREMDWLSRVVPPVFVLLLVCQRLDSRQLLPFQEFQ